MLARHRHWPFLVALVGTTVLLLWPGDAVPDGPPVSDKVVHALLFAMLALAGAVAGHARLPLALGLVGYAGVTEALQRLLPINRYGDLRDLLADAIGVGLGLVVTELLVATRRARPAESSGTTSQRADQ